MKIKHIFIVLSFWVGLMPYLGFGLDTRRFVGLATGFVLLLLTYFVFYFSSQPVEKPRKEKKSKVASSEISKSEVVEVEPKVQVTLDEDPNRVQARLTVERGVLDGKDVLEELDRYDG